MFVNSIMNGIVLYYYQILLNTICECFFKVDSFVIEYFDLRIKNVAIILSICFSRVNSEDSSSGIEHIKIIVCH